MWSVAVRTGLWFRVHILVCGYEILSRFRLTFVLSLLAEDSCQGYIKWSPWQQISNAVIKINWKLLIEVWKLTETQTLLRHSLPTVSSVLLAGTGSVGGCFSVAEASDKMRSSVLFHLKMWSSTVLLGMVTLCFWWGASPAAQFVILEGNDMV